MAGNTSNTFLASMSQGLNLAHTAENDKRLEQQAAIMNQMHQMQMVKMAQEFAFDKEVQDNPELRKSLTASFEQPEEVNKSLEKGMPFSKAKDLYVKKQAKPDMTLENILATKVKSGEMTLQDAYSFKQQNKEFNVPAEVDTFLMTKFPNYASDPKVRATASNWLSTPEGKQAYDSWWTTRKQTGPTVITYLPGEGGQYFPAPTRGHGLPPPNQPIQQPGGKPIQKPVSQEQLSKIADLLTLESNINVIESNFDKSYVGPVAGRMGGMKEKFVELPEKQITFYSATRDAQDALLRARSGAQINEQEYARLVNFLPDTNQPAANFTARLRRFKKELQTTLANKKAMLSQGGAVKIPEPVNANNPEPQGATPKATHRYIPGQGIVPIGQ